MNLNEFFIQLKRHISFQIIVHSRDDADVFVRNGLFVFSISMIIGPRETKKSRLFLLSRTDLCVRLKIASRVNKFALKVHCCHEEIAGIRCFLFLKIPTKKKKTNYLLTNFFFVLKNLQKNSEILDVSRILVIDR